MAISTNRIGETRPSWPPMSSSSRLSDRSARAAEPVPELERERRPVVGRVPEITGRKRRARRPSPRTGPAPSAVGAGLPAQRQRDEHAERQTGRRCTWSTAPRRARRRRRTTSAATRAIVADARAREARRRWSPRRGEQRRVRRREDQPGRGERHDRENDRAISGARSPAETSRPPGTRGTSPNDPGEHRARVARRAACRPRAASRRR